MWIGRGYVPSDQSHNYLYNQPSKLQLIFAVLYLAFMNRTCNSVGSRKVFTINICCFCSARNLLNRTCHRLFQSVYRYKFYWRNSFLHFFMFKPLVFPARNLDDRQMLWSFEIQIISEYKRYWLLKLVHWFKFYWKVPFSWVKTDHLYVYQVI